MEVPEIDIAELERRQATGMPLIDVREPDEYTEAHVAGAILIPLATLPEHLDDLPDGPLNVICAAGGRSHKAAEFLIANGYDATNGAGGTNAWVESGRSYLTGEAPA